MLGVEGMVPLSQKPDDQVAARPKTLEFQDRRRRQDHEQQLKADRFARLNVRVVTGKVLP